MGVVIIALLCSSLVLQRALCQEPQRPVIPDSFMFQAIVEYYGGAMQAMLAMDFDTGAVVQTFQLASCPSAVEFITQPEKEEEHLILSMGPVRVCKVDSVPNDKPTIGFFAWVQKAVYDGQDATITGVALDFWSYNLHGGGDMRLGVSPNNTNVPVVLWIRSNSLLSTNLLFDIIDFEPGTPPAEVFQPPPHFCPPTPSKLSAPIMSQPPMVMPPFMPGLMTGKGFMKLMPDIGKLQKT